MNRRGAPIGDDVRKRVVYDYFTLCLPVKEIVEKYRISRNSVINWTDRFRKTKSVSPTKNYRKGVRCKITDLAYFEQFVQERNDKKTGKEMWQEWKESHVSVAYSTFLVYLGKINYTCKKKRFYIKKGPKKNELNSKKRLAK